MHEVQQVGMLQIMVMAVNPKKEEISVKGDQFDPNKDPSTVKSVFSLGNKDREQ